MTGAGVVASSASAATTNEQSAVSANWSGYGRRVRRATQTSSSRASLGAGPSRPPTAAPAKATPPYWVGLGGSGQGSQHLEQVGTESDCSGTGAASHYAWWEIVPAAPVRVDVTISPGDHVSAKVTVSGTNVTMSLTDNTTGQSATKTAQMSDPDLSSAEWIAEAPSQCDGSGTARRCRWLISGPSTSRTHRPPPTAIAARSPIPTGHRAGSAEWRLRRLRLVHQIGGRRAVWRSAPTVHGSRWPSRAAASRLRPLRRRQ